MNNLEFKYEIIPGTKNGTAELAFQARPMAFEKDEIKLSKKFWYKQAFFFVPKALHGQNISDVLWVEDNIDNILSLAAKETKSDKEDVFQSKQYCLNINYRFKTGGNSTQFKPLHSQGAQEGDDTISVPAPHKALLAPSPAAQSPFKKASDILPAKSEDDSEDTVQQPCLVPFVIWQEREILTSIPEINTVSQ